jgi:hypothetical protein
MVDPIKVGAGLSGTIASHKTLTLVVGITMIKDKQGYIGHHIENQRSRITNLTNNLQCTYTNM